MKLSKILSLIFLGSFTGFFGYLSGLMLVNRQEFIGLFFLLPTGIFLVVFFYILFKKDWKLIDDKPDDWDGIGFG